jgi:hypothetical protein
LVPVLSIAENIFLGNEHASAGVISWHEAMTHAQRLLDRVGLDESPRTRISDIGVMRSTVFGRGTAQLRDTTRGDGMELEAIAAAFFGGASANGGVGRSSEPSSAGSFSAC